MSVTEQSESNGVACETVRPPPQSFGANVKEVLFGDFDHQNIPLEKDTWPVIIIGSSMVGMMTGLLLGYHGIKSVSFDRHPPSGTHPRAAGLNYRTVEILRQLGLEAEAKGESAKEFDIDAGMLVVEKLVGGKIIAHVQENDPSQVRAVTPCPSWLWITQAMFEPLLRANASKFGCTQMYGQLVVHYEEEEDGVLVVVQDIKTQVCKKYKTKYLVAADGNRSGTRVKEGIKLEGVGTLRNSVSLRIAGELAPHLGSRSVHGVVYVLNPSISGGFRLENQGRNAILMVNRAGEKKDFPEGSVTADEARQYMYDLTGLGEDVDVQIQNISYWTMTSFNADRLRSKGGRVLIAGDAAHTMPPTGGLGGNTGVGDAHNLAWKLAFVLKGLAGPDLLATYSVERQAVDAFAVDQATKRFYNRVDHVQPPIAEEPNLTVELGYRYGKGKPFENPLEPSGTAGTRFPHVWLQQADTSAEDRQISTLDIVKQKLLLVATEPKSSWIAAATTVASPAVELHELHSDSAPLRDTLNELGKKCKLQAGEALLVRPDGFIAWRAPATGEGHDEMLRTELARLLGQ